MAHRTRPRAVQNASGSALESDTHRKFSSLFDRFLIHVGMALDPVFFYSSSNFWSIFDRCFIDFLDFSFDVWSILNWFLGPVFHGSFLEVSWVLLSDSWFDIINTWIHGSMGLWIHGPLWGWPAWVRLLAACCLSRRNIGSPIGSFLQILDRRRIMCVDRRDGETVKNNHSPDTTLKPKKQ